MKHFITHLSLLLLIFGTAHAQAPQGIPYQAAARNSTGAVLASTPISVRFTIRDSIATGTIKYRETHNITTDANGMFSLVIGQGTPISGSFAAINWATNAKFQQVELDPAGGSSYIDMGTQQMLSVPYAFNATSASSVNLTVSVTGDTLYSGGGKYVIIPGISAANFPLYVGMNYGGGIIAYILQPGDPGYIACETHGLIAAPNDLGSGISWGCSGTIIGGTSTALGTGAANTAAIVAACATSGIAARLCANLVLGGFDDWYLPSRDEMQKLNTNREIIGGFTIGWDYWTSSENSSTLAWHLDLGSGGVFNTHKNSTRAIRAVRSF